MTAKRKKEDRKPLWAIIALIIFGLIHLTLGIGLIYEPVGTVLLDKELETITNYFLFSQVCGLLIMGVIALSIFLPHFYSPKGGTIDTSHKWVFAGSGQKVRNATIKDVYEHQHGSGSWEKKVETECKILTFLCVLSAVGAVVYGVYYLFSAVQLPVINEIRKVLESDVVFWLSWLVLALMGSGSFFLMKFAFWDFKLASGQMLFSADGRYHESKYKNPSLLLLIPRFILLVAVALMSIYLFIDLIFPQLTTSKFWGAYDTLLPVFFFMVGALWLLGGITPGPAYSTGYKRELKRQEDFKATKSTMEGAIELLFSQDSTQKVRYLSALFLLKERDKLTSAGTKQVIEALQLLTGEDFGNDYRRWINWLQYQI